MELSKKDQQQVTKNQVPSHLKPYAKPPPATALEEDEYIEGLAKIIKRDFFPDLDKLKVQNQLLEAVNAADTLRARHLGQKLAEITGKTPRTPITLKEPSSTLNVDLKLDEFQTKYTSEDNASFSEIIQRTNSEKKEKYHWFYDTEKKQMLLTSEEQNRLIEEHISKPVIAWDHKARSALMYGPEGLPFTPNDLPKTRAAPKALVHSATRFDNPNQVDVELEETDEQRNASTVWKNMAQATPGLFRGDSTPMIAGYKLVPQTPELRPNVDIDPSALMTWGVVESTPIQIDSGPSFKMQEPPKREIVANKLSERAAASIRKKSATPRFKTPLSRGMSPAAIALTRNLHRSGGLDQALRSSYQVTPKPKASPRKTPSVFTPSMKIPHATPTQSTPSQKPGKDMTDDLLNL